MSSDGSSHVDLARRETVRYHEEFYATSHLGQAGTWLARPHRLLFDALRELPCDRPLIAYDLGAGIGRHTVPMLEILPAGSEVYAVDLLPSALRALRDLAHPAVGTTLHTRVGDLDDFAFESRADLVFAFSAVEHLPDLVAVRRLLARTRDAMAPGGVIAVGVMADRFETDSRGTRRPALLESEISSAAAIEVLREAFDGFEQLRLDSRGAEVTEVRGDEAYVLTSTLVSFVAVRPPTVSTVRGSAIR